MLTTWKMITQYTGFSRNTIKRLVKEESFPLIYIASRPVTTRQQIETWIEMKMAEEEKHKK